MNEEGDDVRTMITSSSCAEEGSSEEGEAKEEEAMPEMVAYEGPDGNGMMMNMNKNSETSLPGMMMRAFFGDVMPDSSYPSSSSLFNQFTILQSTF